MFLSFMKKKVLFICILILATSCGEYQKVYKSQDAAAKYAMAEELYQEGIETDSNAKLRRALKLFEQVVPQFRGKPQAQRLQFLYADTYYQLGDYLISSYQFERFAQLYPSSTKLEEALFKAAKSHYMESPRFSLDQTETYKAISKLQAYINRFPEGEYMDEANELVKELRFKLDKKAYEIAKQYHHMRKYKAAVEAFENFILDHPGSVFRERAYYYKFDSAYQLAINSVLQKVPERLAAAEEYYENYKNYYPEGQFINEATAAYQDINERQENGANLTTQTTL